MEGELCNGEALCLDGYGPVSHRLSNLHGERLEYSDAESVPAALIDTTCAACPLVHTKPEPVPGYLSHWIAFAEEHDALQSKGVVFQEDHLTSEQRAVLLGKTRAENRRDQLREWRRRREDATRQNAAPTSLGRYTNQPLVKW